MSAGPATGADPTSNRVGPIGRLRSAGRRQALWVLGVLTVVILVDQLTKAWAWRHLSGAVLNTGSTWFLGHTISSWYRAVPSGALLDLASAQILAFSLFTLLRRPRPLPVLLPAALSISGWASNLGDRLGLHLLTAPGMPRGAVDFAPLGHCIFNIADACIATGTLLLGASMCCQRRGRAAAAAPTAFPTVAPAAGPLRLRQRLGGQAVGHGGRRRERAGASAFSAPRVSSITPRPPELSGSTMSGATMSGAREDQFSRTASAPGWRRSTPTPRPVVCASTTASSHTARTSADGDRTRYGCRVVTPRRIPIATAERRHVPHLLSQIPPRLAPVEAGASHTVMSSRGDSGASVSRSSPSPPASSERTTATTGGWSAPCQLTSAARKGVGLVPDRPSDR